MEATDEYWMTLYDIQEESGFEVHILTRANSKNLQGRKQMPKIVIGFDNYS